MQQQLFNNLFRTRSVLYNRISPCQYLKQSCLLIRTNTSTMQNLTMTHLNFHTLCTDIHPVDFIFILPSLVLGIKRGSVVYNVVNECRSISKGSLDTHPELSNCHNKRGLWGRDKEHGSETQQTAPAFSTG